jgi:hypothetical protein
MWVLHLRLIIHLKLFKSPMDYFKINSHASIAYKFRLGLHLRLLKSHKGYIETNLNMGIAFGETQKKGISFNIW